MKDSKKRAAKDVLKNDSQEVLNRIDSLKVGVSFDSFNGMKDSIKDWQDTFFMPLVVMRKYKGRLTMMCPHAIQTERQPKLKPVNYSGCPVLVDVREQTDGSWKVTKCVVKHSGHVVGQSVYNNYRNVKKLSKEDEEFVAELVKVGTKPRIIAQKLSDRTGKNYVAYDIQNLINRLRTSFIGVRPARRSKLSERKAKKQPKHQMKSESPLSEYEKIRNNNIRERKVMLAQLMSDVGQYKKDIGMVTKPPSKMKKKKVNDDEDYHAQINIPPRRTESTRNTTRQKKNMFR